MSDGDAALSVFAVAPLALGGVRLRCAAGPQRDAWLQALRSVLPADMPLWRLPVHASEEALHGGLDLAATLAAGRPVAERGLLARAEGGLVIAAMAERMSASRAATLGRALDAASMAVIALDEGADDDELPPPSLLDRLALQCVPERDAPVVDAARIAAARGTWRSVALDDALLEALVATAAALGVASSRASWQALCAARIAAALEGRGAATTDDVALAARLVLAPRATRLPPSESAEPPESPPPPDNASNDAPSDDEPDTQNDQPLEDRVLEAAQAAIPPGLLALLATGRAPAPRRGDAGRVGTAAASRQRGRPIGAVRGEPRGGARLALIDTLRAAAPWQRVRRAAFVDAQRVRGAAPFVDAHRVQGAAALPDAQRVQGAASGDTSRVIVSKDDLRIQRRQQRRATTTIFAIDASGSQALHRLAEAKGAVELLLADCYARRDRVAVIGFRGQDAQVLLAPTRSLVRAKRQLAGLPGGGGTPLASGIDAAHALAGAVRRGGATPLVVLLTDGRANVARNGAGGREQAAADALSAARAFAAAGTAALLIDTSPQPSPAAAALAGAMRARCIALPHAGAEVLSNAVRVERGSTGPRAPHHAG